jgi:hypothetical protein
VVIVVLLNLYVAMSVVSGAVGLHGVQQFYTTKAEVQAKAQVEVTCPAPRHLQHGLPSGPIPSLKGYKSW